MPTSTHDSLKSWVAEQTGAKPDQFLLSQKLREPGLATLTAGQYPDRKDEEWRYTPVKRLLMKDLFSAPAETALDSILSQAKEAVPEARHLIFMDGLFRSDLSDPLGDVRGLSLIQLGQETPVELKEAQSMISTAEWSDDNIFKAMSISLARSGIFLRLEKGVEVSTPLHFIYISSGNRTTPVQNPLTFIQQAENSKLMIVEQYGSAGQNSIMTVPAAFIQVAEGAHLQHYKLSLEGADIEHVSNTHVLLAAASSASLHQYLLGSGLSRTNTEVKFAGQGAAVKLRGIYLGEKSQHLDIRTFIDHAQPYCNSDQHYRGILDDESRGVFNGLVLVRPDAQHTDAQQSNKNLLLSDTARVDSKPQLEIFADDVKCAHGATVGQLDGDALFYLQSRGISKSDAKLMLTRAFTNEVTDDIELVSFREYLEATLFSRLNRLHIDHA